MKTLDKTEYLCGRFYWQIIWIPVKSANRSEAYHTFERRFNMNANCVKNALVSQIHQLSPHDYSRHPGIDFSRERKLPFHKMISIILGMRGGSLTNELMDHFDFDPECVSSSAFVQQRAKILPETFLNLLINFNDAMAKIHTPLTYHSLRLLAVDGSDVRIPTNPDDKESFYPGVNDQRSYNLIHLNAMYDLLQNTYVDATIQKHRNTQERQAMISMIERSVIQSALIIADRGYESYNCMAHIQEKGWYYLMRVQEKQGIGCGLDLPDSDEFDLEIELNLTRRNTKEVKALLKEKNRYRFLPVNVNFDYLPKLNGRHKTETLFYTLSFRIVRVRISNDTIETLVTNLPSHSYPVEELKRLYSLRWGIETSFRSLKYTVGLLHFHSKNIASVYQEVFASLLMYNFTAWVITLSAVRQKSEKYSYRVNFAAAVHICRELLWRDNHPPDIKKLIAKYVSPIRPNRTHSRKPTSSLAINFIYRIS